MTNKVPSLLPDNLTERFLYTLMRKLEEMRIPEDLYQYPKVVKEFDDRPPTWKEFTAVLRKTRNKSPPGPNGIPYKVYKKCTSVA